MIFHLHCDVSFDGGPPDNTEGRFHAPTTYVFAGFFANEGVWESIQRKWNAINHRHCVSRFHASHLNCKTHEYEGWDDIQKVAYSSELLKALNEEEKELSAVSVGIYADEYRKLISDEGRRKMGSPYLVCFNSLIARVAKAMDDRGFPPHHQFSVLIDKDDGYRDAIESFDAMRANAQFAYRSRLGTCIPGDMGSLTVLQPADLIAYEVYKWMFTARREARESAPAQRPPLKMLLQKNHVAECYLGAKTLRKMKPFIESTPAENGGLVIIPRN